jgi:hypothetical protein
MRVSDDTEGFTYHPAEPPRRRVSMLVAVPVVAGCAAIGALAGVLAPLRAPHEPGREKAAQVQPVPARATPKAQASGSAAAETVAAAPVTATPASAEQSASAPGEVREASPPRARPVALQPVRTISEEEASAPLRPPAIETGSVELRSPGAAGDADGPGKRAKDEAARSAAPARPEGHVRRLRAKRLRRAYVQRPAQPSLPPLQPPSQNSYTSLVPPQ